MHKTLKTAMIVFAALFLLRWGAAAQMVDFDKVVPPTPEAAHLQSEIKVPVDQSTGIPNIQVPLYTLKTVNLSVPIYLTYHASGIRVGQLASSTGLGWGLNAGGGVVRTIRRNTDDNGWFLNNYTNYYAQSLTLAGTIGANDVMLEDFDFSQDDYSYNFMGFGGNFYFDSTKTLRLLEKTPLSLSYFRLQKRFEAKDMNGTAYYFDSTESSYSSSFPSNNPSNTALKGGTTAWKLTKIKYQGIDSIQFDYMKYTVDYDDIGADVYDFKGSFLDCVPGDPGEDYSGCTSCGDDFPTQLYHMVSERNFETMLVNEIRSQTQTVRFYYSDDLNATVWKKKLDSLLVFSNQNNILVKKIILRYSRFSNGQLKLDAVRDYDIENNSFEETGFSYYESDLITMPGIGSKSKDLFGYFNNKTNQYLIVTDDPEYSLAQADRKINKDVIFLGSLQSISYPTGGYTEFVYEPNRIDSNKYGPGLRLKGVWEYNGVDKVPNRTLYEYYGYNGQTVTFPYSMLGIAHNVTYHRKFFSSDEPLNYHVPLGVVPLGYGYDSVVEKKTGTDEVLLNVYKFKIFPFYNGYKALPINSVTYKNASGSYLPVSKHETTYSHSINYEHETPLLDVQRAWQVLTTSFIDTDILTCQTVSGGFYLMYSYDEHDIRKIRERDVAFSGNDSAVTETRYYYDTHDHMQPVRIVKTNSTDSTVTVLKYPPEMVDDGLDPAHVYQYMTNALIRTPLIVSETSNGRVSSLKKTETAYDFSGGFFAPVTYKESSLGGTPELRKKITHYNSYGAVTDYQLDSMKYAFLWDDTLQRPVARIKNGSSSTSKYTGFESSVSGSWNFVNGGALVTAHSLTGKNAYQLSTGNSIVGNLSAPTDVLVTYWVYSGSFLVNGQTGTPLSTLNGWTCYQHQLTNVSTVTVSGTGILDELRLYTSNGSMETYVYDHSGRVVSICDASDRITYYDYNGAGKLVAIRDQNNDVLKKFSYNLKRTAPASATIYYNDEFSDFFTREGCPTGYHGTTITYTVPEGRCFSTVSQTDANNMSQLHFYDLGQLYANTFGKCEVDAAPPNCQLPSKRMINGVCVRGLIVYTSSVYDPGSGKYNCAFHYEWMDGYQSEELMIISDSPCL